MDYGQFSKIAAKRSGELVEKMLARMSAQTEN